MAKYEDYRKKADALQAEIDDAARASEDRNAENPEDRIPERFRGKTPEEIAQSYEELERAFSRQGNDLGVMRKTLDEFIRLQSEVASQEPTPEQQPVDMDSLYADPDETIRKVVRRETGSRIEQLERELAKERFNAQLSTVDARYPGWREKAQTPEFREWVQAESYRIRMALDADQRGDAAAAEALVAMYYDQHKSARKPSEADISRATLESSGPAVPDIDVPMSRTEIIQKKIEARRGDPEAKMWLRQNAARITAAYAGGHVTD